MPTYEYACDTCSKEYEIEQKIVDPPIEKCETEKCEGTPKRVISRSNFALKGSGWFKDGYSKGK